MQEKILVMQMKTSLMLVQYADDTFVFEASEFTENGRRFIQSGLEKLLQFFENHQLNTQKTWLY